MMELPRCPQRSPYVVTVKAGEKYFWCACGRSQTQPFCDGSHKGTGFTPVKLTAEKDERVFFCGCKRSGNKPFCDGTHKTVKVEEAAH